MRQDLQAADILLYHVLASDTLDIQRLISLGERDGSNADTQYYHAGLVLDPAKDQGFEMNPPASGYTSLQAQPWNRIDVYRPTVPVDLGRLQAWCAVNKGTPYPYEQIAKFLGADIAADVTGFDILEKWLDAPLSTPRSPHLDVCSATVADALDDATHGNMGWNRLDANVRPCDIPAGKVVLVVDAAA